MKLSFVSSQSQNSVLFSPTQSYQVQQIPFTSKSQDSNSQQIQTNQQQSQQQQKQNNQKGIYNFASFGQDQLNSPQTNQINSHKSQISPPSMRLLGQSPNNQQQQFTLLSSTSGREQLLLSNSNSKQQYSRSPKQVTFSDENRENNIINNNNNNKGLIKNDSVIKQFSLRDARQKQQQQQLLLDQQQEQQKQQQQQQQQQQQSQQINDNIRIVENIKEDQTQIKQTNNPIQLNKWQAEPSQITTNQNQNNKNERSERLKLFQNNDNQNNQENQSQQIKNEPQYYLSKRKPIQTLQEINKQQQQQVEQIIKEESEEESEKKIRNTNEFQNNNNNYNNNIQNMYGDNNNYIGQNYIMNEQYLEQKNQQQSVFKLPTQQEVKDKEERIKNVIVENKKISAIKKSIKNRLEELEKKIELVNKMDGKMLEELQQFDNLEESAYNQDDNNSIYRKSITSISQKADSNSLQITPRINNNSTKNNNENNNQNSSTQVLQQKIQQRNTLLNQQQPNNIVDNSRKYYETEINNTKNKTNSLEDYKINNQNQKNQGQNNSNQYDKYENEQIEDIIKQHQIPQHNNNFSFRDRNGQVDGIVLQNLQQNQKDIDDFRNQFMSLQDDKTNQYNNRSNEQFMNKIYPYQQINRSNNELNVSDYSRNNNFNNNSNLSINKSSQELKNILHDDLNRSLSKHKQLNSIKESITQQIMKSKEKKINSRSNGTAKLLNDILLGNNDINNNQFQQKQQSQSNFSMSQQGHSFFDEDKLSKYLNQNQSNSSHDIQNNNNNNILKNQSEFNQIGDNKKINRNYSNIEQKKNIPLPPQQISSENRIKLSQSTQNVTAKVIENKINSIQKKIDEYDHHISNNNSNILNKSSNNDISIFVKEELDHINKNDKVSSNNNLNNNNNKPSDKQQIINSSNYQEQSSNNNLSKIDNISQNQNTDSYISFKPQNQQQQNQSQPLEEQQQIIEQNERQDKNEQNNIQGITDRLDIEQNQTQPQLQNLIRNQIQQKEENQRMLKQQQKDNNYSQNNTENINKNNDTLSNINRNNHESFDLSYSNNNMNKKGNRLQIKKLAEFELNYKENKGFEKETELYKKKINEIKKDIDEKETKVKLTEKINQCINIYQNEKRNQQNLQNQQDQSQLLQLSGSKSKLPQMTNSNMFLNTATLGNSLYYNNTNQFGLSQGLLNQTDIINIPSKLDQYKMVNLSNSTCLNSPTSNNNRRSTSRSKKSVRFLHPSEDKQLVEGIKQANSSKYQDKIKKIISQKVYTWLNKAQLLSQNTLNDNNVQNQSYNNTFKNNTQGYKDKNKSSSFNHSSHHFNKNINYQ